MCHWKERIFLHKNKYLWSCWDDHRPRWGRTNTRNQNLTSTYIEESCEKVWLSDKNNKRIIFICSSKLKNILLMRIKKTASKNLFSFFFYCVGKKTGVKWGTWFFGVFSVYKGLFIDQIWKKQFLAWILSKYWFFIIRI